MAEPGFKMRSLASQPLLFPAQGCSGVWGMQIRFPARDRAPHSPLIEESLLRRLTGRSLELGGHLPLPQWAGAVQAVMWPQRH